MASINQIYLLGNLTRDPELKYSNEGIAISEMGLAVNKRWRNSNTDENNSVDYFNITAWNNLAENCAVSLKKGDRVIVCGHLNLRSWENRDGKKFNILNINADVIALSLEFNAQTISSSKNSSDKKSDLLDKNNKIKVKKVRLKENHSGDNVISNYSNYSNNDDNSAAGINSVDATDVNDVYDAADVSDATDGIDVIDVNDDTDGIDKNDNVDIGSFSK